MHIRTLLVCFTLTAGPAAAEKPGGKPPSSEAGTGGANAAKKEAQAAFARQEAGAAKIDGTAPAITGIYIWGGRADQNYRPFVQWELRLRAGTAALPGLQGRVATLGPKREVQTQGDWRKLGDLAAGGRLDGDLRLNCSTFAAYQIELKWGDGKAQETYLAGDRQSLPQALGGLGDLPCLLAVGATADYDASARKAVVAWSLWNLGRTPARGVELIIHFRDEAGKEVQRATWKPDKGLVAAGASRECRLEVARVPAYAGIAIDTRMAEITAPDGSATAAPASAGTDIEVAGLRADRGRLRATLRNGLPQAVKGLVVVIALKDKGGKELKKLELAGGDLAPGASREVEADLGGLAAWDAFDVAWRTAH